MIISNDILSTPPDIILNSKEFGALYIALREKEGRIYSDAQVASLPETDPDHIHYSEWQVRKRSADRLINYLERKVKPLNILEVGCGNGWLSGKLSDIKNTNVRGIDVNELELSQAKRVFGRKTNILFEASDLRSIKNTGKFDIIVFAASIQYFPDFHQVVRDSQAHLVNDGEIHILDSHFYQKDEIQMAARRSRAYYQSIGFGKMAECYFHHTVDSLKAFEYKMLYDPYGLANKIFHRKDPFPWICIKST